MLPIRAVRSLSPGLFRDALLGLLGVGMLAYGVLNGNAGFCTGMRREQAAGDAISPAIRGPTDSGHSPNSTWG